MPVSKEDYTRKWIVIKPITWGLKIPSAFIEILSIPEYMINSQKLFFLECINIVMLKAISIVTNEQALSIIQYENKILTKLEADLYHEKFLTNLDVKITPKTLLELNQILLSCLFNVFGSQSIKLLFLSNDLKKFVYFKDEKEFVFSSSVGIAGQTVISSKMVQWCEKNGPCTKKWHHEYFFYKKYSVIVTLYLNCNLIYIFNTHSF